MKSPVVLLIEDQLEVRDSLRKQLVQSGFTVLEADDLAEGFRCFLKQLPDLIVSKVANASSVSVQTMTEMKKLHPICRIVAISDDWMKLATSKARQFDAQFCKPFSQGALVKAILSFFPELNQTP